MKKLLSLLFIVFMTSCASDKILIKAEKMSKDQYLVVCKGYPKEGLTSSLQRSETAKEAALINAQRYAAERLKDVDTTRGTIYKFNFNGEYAIIHYIIEIRDVEKYIVE